MQSEAERKYFCRKCALNMNGPNDKVRCVNGGFCEAASRLTPADAPQEQSEPEIEISAEPVAESEIADAPQPADSAAVEPAPVERLVPTSRVMDNGLVLVEMQTSAVGYYMRYGDHLKQIANLRAELSEARQERDEARAANAMVECVWCGFAITKRDEAGNSRWPEMEHHLMTCEKRYGPSGRKFVEWFTERMTAAESARDQAQASAVAMRQKTLDEVAAWLRSSARPNAARNMLAALSSTSDRAVADGKAEA